MPAPGTDAARLWAHYDRAMYGSGDGHFHVFRRALTWEPFEGGAGRSVHVEAVLGASADKVWRALTTPEVLVVWLGEVTGHLCEGGHFALAGNASGSIHACEPRTRICLDWDFGGGHSRVEARLTPSGHRCEVTLVNSMPESTLETDEHWLTYGPAASGVGWESVLFGLHHYLLTGESLDEEAWVASREGREFIEASAAVWADVHISTGADEAAARAAADRTRAFYLGEE